MRESVLDFSYFSEVSTLRRGAEAQRRRGAEAQRRRGAEAQRRRGAEAQNSNQKIGLLGSMAGVLF